MKRLFVFGIGGTGSRVMKSLVMLLASGIDTNGFEIVPILIDPHQDLDEFNNCVQLLKLYQDLHEMANPTHNLKNQVFFKTSINKELANGFTFDFGKEIQSPFKDFIKFSDMKRVSTASYDLMQLLFSEQNLNKEMSVGFKGNPNIGSIVLNKLQSSKDYKNFKNTFSDGDRIFIISSIFGGTGASGFPLLLKNLRADIQTRNAIIGALTVMPYFKLTENSESDIDSKNFNTKTKSALSYYHDNLTEIEAIYYLADPDGQTTAYENDEKRQPNKSHLIELVGALAILDFTENHYDAGVDRKYSEFGLQSDSKNITFSTIGEKTKGKIGPNLTALFLAHYAHFDHQAKDITPLKALGFGKNHYQKIGKFNEFLKLHFIPWLKELEGNERAFSPFNMDVDTKLFQRLVRDFEIERPGPLRSLFSNSRFEVEDITLKMSGPNKKKFEHMTTEAYYFTLLTNACLELIKNKIPQF